MFFCCSKQELIIDNHKTVCKICGAVISYSTIDEYIDFYENKCKMVRKSVYHRKYHIRNIVNNMSINGNKISFQNGLKIFRVFKEIEKILPQVNGDRKRMINTNFILKELFKMMKLPHNSSGNNVPSAPAGTPLFSNYPYHFLCHLS